MKRFSQQFLLIYCAVLSTVSRCDAYRRKHSTKPILRRNSSASHRHCRTEWNPEDGTSNQNRLPGVIIKGKEQPSHDRPRRE
jgi:hypothetical protein